MSKERTQTPWWFEEGEHSWQLFGGGNSIEVEIGSVKVPIYTHPLQILKAPKKDTPYAEYWPNEADAAFLIRAVNSHDALVEACEAHETYLAHVRDCKDCAETHPYECGEAKYLWGRSDSLRKAALAKAKGA